MNERLRVRPEYIISIEVLYMKIVLFKEGERKGEGTEHIIFVKCIVTYIFRHNERENAPNIFEH